MTILLLSTCLAVMVRRSFAKNVTGSEDKVSSIEGGGDAYSDLVQRMGEMESTQREMFKLLRKIGSYNSEVVDTEEISTVKSIKEQLDSPA